MKLTAEHIAKLYDCHAPDVLRFLGRKTNDFESAVDLTAETFARAIAERHRFVGESDEDARRWIFTIARHLSVDLARRGSIERSAMEQFGWQRRALNVNEYERIEELVDAESVGSDVMSALDELPADQRDVLRMRVLEEQPYATIATETGVSEQAVRARVSRALTALRETRTICRLREEQGHG